MLIVSKMKCSSYLLICVALATKLHAAPWDDENEMNENDLEWQCNTLCTSCNAIPIYQSETSMCYCNIDPGEVTDIDWNRIKKNAKYLGLSVEVINSKAKHLSKREIETVNGKQDVENPPTKNESKIPLHERLRVSLLTKKQLRQQAPETEPVATKPIATDPIVGATKDNSIKIIAKNTKPHKKLIVAKIEPKNSDRRELLRKRIHDRIEALKLRTSHKSKGANIVGNPHIPEDTKPNTIIQPKHLIS